MRTCCFVSGTSPATSAINQQVWQSAVLYRKTTIHWLKFNKKSYKIWVRQLWLHKLLWNSRFCISKRSALFSRVTWDACLKKAVTFNKLYLRTPVTQRMEVQGCISFSKYESWTLAVSSWKIFLDTNSFSWTQSNWPLFIFIAWLYNYWTFS